jgi:prophage regulatory protein
MSYEIEQSDRFLKMPEVVCMTGISKAQIYVLISRGKFPRQAKLFEGGKSAGWLYSEVKKYMEN